MNSALPRPVTNARRGVEAATTGSVPTASGPVRTAITQRARRVSRNVRTATTNSAKGASMMKSALIAAMDDPSVPNQALAAEILINKLDYMDALEVLRAALQSKHEVVRLQSAISLRNIGDQAKPLVPFVEEEVYPEISGKVWGRYKTWLYPMFIGMAVDQTLINCGKEVDIKN